MCKTKKNRIKKNNAELDIEKIKVGDVVAIEWLDAHSYERIEVSELDDLEEPEATRCWGAVIRKGNRYLFIASEIGDSESDGVWIEALPYRMIHSCKVIDKTVLDL